MHSQSTCDVSSCWRQNNESSNMFMSSSLKPVNMFAYMQKGIKTAVGIYAADLFQKHPVSISLESFHLISFLELSKFVITFHPCLLGSLFFTKSQARALSVLHHAIFPGLPALLKTSYKELVINEYTMKAQ